MFATRKDITKHRKIFEITGWFSQFTGTTDYFIVLCRKCFGRLKINQYHCEPADKNSYFTIAVLFINVIGDSVCRMYGIRFQADDRD